jgi:hypothetical protein
MLSERALRGHAPEVLVLMSVGHATLSQVPVECENAANPNWFDFAGARSDRYGDGRVHLKSAAIRGITLAAYSGTKMHGMVCRDETIINSTSMWLQKGGLIRMRPRTARDRVRRQKRKRDYFTPWDGRAGSLANHVVS